MLALPMEAHFLPGGKAAKAKNICAVQADILLTIKGNSYKV